MSETMITMSDIRDAGFCAAGLRDFCVTHGVDLRRLVREGIPISEVQHIDDANLRVVVAAKQEAEA